MASARGVRWPAGDTALLALIVIGAVILRVIGIQFGLPDVYNPDEGAIMTRALSFGQGTLNPGNFLYPTFYFYVLFAWVGLYLGFLLVTGKVESIGALQRLFFTAPERIYTAGRLLGVAAAAVTIVLIHRLALVFGDRRAALAAAFFLAVAPLHVRDSHYVKHDVPAVLAIVAAYLAIVRLWPAHAEPESLRRRVVVAGAACGAAFSTHYYCVFLALPLSLATVLASRAKGAYATFGNLAIAALVSVVVFFAFSPFILVEPATAWRDIIGNRQIVVDRAVETGAFAPARRYFEILWTDSAGQPIVLLAVAGIVWMLIAAPMRAALLLAFPVPFLLFILNTAPASRYLNPLLPFVALFAAWVLSQAVARMRAPAGVFWAAVALAAAPALATSIRTGQFFRQADTRALAEGFLEQKVAPGTTVAIQPYSVALTPTRDGILEALAQNGEADSPPPKFALQLSLDPYPSPAYRLIYLGSGGLDVDKIYVAYEQLGGADPLAELRRLGVTFVVVKRYNDPAPATLPFLNALTRDGRRIAEFSPYRSGTTEAERARIEPFLHNTDTRIVDALERPGPVLEIWELNGSGISNGNTSQ